MSLPKIITVLVEFGRRVEAILVEIQKLVSKPQLEPIQPPLSFTKTTPQKPLVELKTLPPHRPGKEVVPEAKKKEPPTIVVPVKKMTERELKTPKTTNSEPSPQRRSAKRKKKKPTPSTEEDEAESSEEEVVESSGEEPESEEEEAEPSTPSLEKKKKIETRASDWKKPAPVSKTLVSLKRPTKTLKKGESSQKKPKKK